MRVIADVGCIGYLAHQGEPTRDPSPRLYEAVAPGDV